MEVGHDVFERQSLPLGTEVVVLLRIGGEARCRIEGLTLLSLLVMEWHVGSVPVLLETDYIVDRAVFGVPDCNLRLERLAKAYPALQVELGIPVAVEVVARYQVV